MDYEFPRDSVSKFYMKLNYGKEENVKKKFCFSLQLFEGKGLISLSFCASLDNTVTRHRFFLI